MPILVLQHSELSRPGRLGLTLRDHAFKLDIRRLDQGDALPEDFDDIDGVISLGGPQNVGGPEPWLKREIDFLREAHARALPLVGVCLGHQLIGAALGAEVGPMDRPEAGLVPLDILPQGQTETILGGIAWKSWQFQMHSYEVKSVPAGATLLASSNACKVQCIRAGLRTYGFQYHFECDRAMIDAYARDCRTEMHKAGLTSDELVRQCEKHYEMFARLGDRLCLNIATCLMGREAALGR